MASISTNSAQFWRGRRVWISGHTGFKGAWLWLWLRTLGANLSGYALAPPTTPSLWDLVSGGTAPRIDDVRDAERVRDALAGADPEVVFHLAAQSLVKESYRDPLGTYATNVVGTAAVLEACREIEGLRCAIVVTSDKVYENCGAGRPFEEGDRLGGRDPYSSSKACAELVTASFRESFFGKGPPLATVRAGNVIGGGDWSTDRLIPDLIRGFLAGSPVLIRHPHAIRPWQHVLEPLHGYITLAEKLLTHDPHFATAYNFGPAESDAQPVDWIADRMRKFWGNGASWTLDKSPTPHEAHYLKLDATRAFTDLDWTPRLNLETALQWLVDWYQAHHAGNDMQSYSLQQIAAYESLLTNKK